MKIEIISRKSVYLRKTFHDRNVLIPWNYNNIVKENEKNVLKKSAMFHLINF